MQQVNVNVLLIYVIRMGNPIAAEPGKLEARSFL